MKKETKERIAGRLIGFGIFCYLGNYYFLIFFRDIILKRFAESVAMIVFWPTYLVLILFLIAGFLLDSAEKDTKKGESYGDN